VLTYTFDKWELPIGRFVLMMGEIEDGVNRLCRRFAPLPVAEELEEFRLGARIDVLGRLVMASGDPKRDQILEALARAKGLLQDRNLVSHTSPQAHVYLDAAERITAVVMKIVGKRGGIDMTRLLAVTATAEKVAQDLYDFVNVSAAP
jgi:hypothetical protein